MKPTSTLCRAALVTAFLAATTAIAAGVEGTPARVVSFADLNLDTPSGVRVLYRRIEHMADRVCELPRETRQLRMDTDLKACRAAATERAVRLVNLPALDALHLAKAGRSTSPVQFAKAR